LILAGRLEEPNDRCWAPATRLFEFIVMTYRYEWRAMSYVLFMHEDYPSFDSRCPLRTTGSSPTSVRTCRTVRSA